MPWSSHGGPRPTVHVMADGVVAESGPPERMFTAPRTEEARRFLGLSSSGIQGDSRSTIQPPSSRR